MANDPVGSYRELPFPPAREVGIDTVRIAMARHHIPVLAEVDVTALPVLPVLATAGRVKELEAKLELIESHTDEWLRARARALSLGAALDTAFSSAEPSDPRESEAHLRDAKKGS